MLTTKEKTRLIAEESARFMDGQFGQLDLSGSPDMQALPDHEFAPHDASGFNNVQLTGVNHLKQMVASPDAELIEEVAAETGNPYLRRELEAERAYQAVLEFKRRNPDYLSCDDNWVSMCQTLSHNLLGRDDLDPDDAQKELIQRGLWTVENLTAAFKTLHRAAALQYPSNYARPLKPAERVRIQQLAANGRVLDGVVQYCEARLGEEQGFQVAFALDDPEAFALDPEMRAVLEEGTIFCWESSRVDYSPTPARREFIRRYCANRFITLPLLDASWAACQAAEKDALRSSLFETAQERSNRKADPPALDSLDDAQVADLYHGTMRERAHSSRRPNGVLV